MTERHIVAMGGGDFSSPDRRMDDFVLSLTGTDRPKVCFLPTASGDNDSYIAWFYRAFSGRGVDATDLVLHPYPPANLRDVVLQQDVIYVGGGSTANLLALWRLHGLDALIREAWENGTVLCGVSAGANCWFEACVTDSFAPALDGLNDGIGILAGSFCPHYDTEAERRPTFSRLVTEGFPAGIACDESAAAVFTDTELHEIVVTDPAAHAYRVSAAGEETLPDRLLD